MLGVPSDLQVAYGKKTIRQFLNTENLREANYRGTQERARQLEEFELKRLALSPQRLDTVTAEMSATV